MTKAKFKRGEIRPAFYDRRDHYRIGDPIPALILGGYAVHRLGDTWRVADLDTGYSIGQRVKMTQAQAKQLAMLYYNALPKITDKRDTIPILGPIYKAFCDSIK